MRPYLYLITGLLVAVSGTAAANPCAMGSDAALVDVMRAASVVYVDAAGARATSGAAPEAPATVHRATDGTVEVRDADRLRTADGDVTLVRRASLLGTTLQVQVQLAGPTEHAMVELPLGMSLPDTGWTVVSSLPTHHGLLTFDAPRTVRVDNSSRRSVILVRAADRPMMSWSIDGFELPSGCIAQN